MKLTPEQELENALVKVNYNVVCDLFDLTEEQRLNPNCGKWIVQTIKQFQTTYTLARAGKLVRSEMMDNPSPTPLPTDNPLLKPDLTNSNEQV